MYYLAYLFDNGFSHSTVSCYISGLGFYCKINDMEDFVVRKTLEGIKRSRPKQKDMRSHYKRVVESHTFIFDHCLQIKL